MTALRVENLTLRFAGLTALGEVSLTVADRSVHALIGPNGAGKSTCFNVISGVYRADSGRVFLGDQDVTGLRPHKLAKLGLGRAFQNLTLSPQSTVIDNVLVGRHCLTRGGFLTAGCRWPRMLREQRRHTERAIEICRFIGVGHLLDRQVGSLSYGDAKRVDICRALATEPRVLMLDEPTAGMNSFETAEIGQMIVDIRDALDIAVLLIEHDMSLVMGIADRISVLDFGKLVAEGTPAEARSDPAVIRAYLGTDAAPGTVLGAES